MPIQNLDKIFRPKRIALLGLTNNPKSVGSITMRNLMDGGYTGVIYPIHPTLEAVMGIPCFPNLNSLPKTPDLAVILSPAREVPNLIDACGKAGILGIMIMSGGFKEAGPEGQALEEELRKRMKNYPGMRILGPNGMGILVPGSNLNISSAIGMPQKGHVAYISQSGALGTALLDWSRESKVGFSFFVSIGNAMDVSFGDLIDYFGQDTNTYSIILYVETIGNARRFLSAARAFARRKPIIVYKSGRFPQSAQAATSHTGALATKDSICDALMRRAGLARVYNMNHIFDFSDLVGHKKIPRGFGLGIITNAGGPGVMATDSLIDNGGLLVPLSNQSIEQLNQILPSYWSKNNPVDVLGDAGPDRIAKAVSIVLDQEDITAVLVILTPQALTQPTQTARKLSELAAKTSKLIMTSWMGGPSMQKGKELLNNAQIAVFNTPEQAIQAYMTLMRYSKNLEMLFETPKEVPVSFSYDRDALRKKYVRDVFPGNRILSENDSKSLLHDYGISGTRPQLAANEEEAVTLAREKGYPIVLKIQSPDVTHKTDVDGVMLNIDSDDMVRHAYRGLIKNFKKHAPEAHLEGITVQKMADTRHAVELIVGFKKEKMFGTVMLVGTGGVNAELFNDQRLEFPPLNERLARQMIQSLKIYPLLEGYRGSPPKNIDKLVEVLIRLSYLAADYPEIEELDINPLIVTPDQVLALDARIVIDPDELGKEDIDYRHLLLRPYPERLIWKTKMNDGTEVTLRPIKPEDEPLWLEMLENCSKETIYSRFRHDFQFHSHPVATQFCVIDYDREMGIVAEIEQDGKKQLIGEGRLLADPDLEMAEFAVLVTDQWQKKGVGFLLTDYSLRIAQIAHVKKVAAETTNNNRAMMNLFKKLDFEIQYHDDGTVSIFKILAGS
ncbi:MAG: bifunctional acetate--CoA ligase family protein/GNAT family N-acetyltransferase [Bacteroidales bacterium]|nr:bifunctional acetate--CoA ligase family protein/GNAT family N-acetyltransferase [Bacteroidales bacterium]